MKDIMKQLWEKYPVMLYFPIKQFTQHQLMHSIKKTYIVREDINALSSNNCAWFPFCKKKVGDCRGRYWNKCVDYNKCKHSSNDTLNEEEGKG